MSRLKVIHNGGLAIAQIDQNLWMKVDESLLGEDDREIFLKRKEAIDLYVANKISLNEIYEITGYFSKSNPNSPVFLDSLNKLFKGFNSYFFRFLFGMSPR